MSSTGMTASPVTDEVQNVLQEIPYHSSSSRVSSRTSKNYSYSDSFETLNQETQDCDYQITSLKEEDNSFNCDYTDDFDTSSDLNSDKNFKQLNDCCSDTKSESLFFCSAILDKRAVFDVSEVSLLQEIPKNEDKVSVSSVDTCQR